MKTFRGIFIVVCGVGLIFMAEKHIQFDKYFQIGFGTVFIIYGVKLIFRRAEK